MPVYEYYCSECRTPFEVLRSMSAADAPVNCINCGTREGVNRTISVFARIGSGERSAEAGLGGSPVNAGGGCCGGTCGCH